MKEDGKTRHPCIEASLAAAVIQTHRGERSGFASPGRKGGQKLRLLKLERQERQVVGEPPKLYLCDVGVAGTLTKRHPAEPRGEQFGRALEHLVFMEPARRHRDQARSRA